MKKFFACLLMTVILTGSMVFTAHVAHAFEIGDYGEDAIAIHRKLSELGYYGLRA